MKVGGRVIGLRIALLAVVLGGMTRCAEDPVGFGKEDLWEGDAGSFGTVLTRYPSTLVTCLHSLDPAVCDDGNTCTLDRCIEGVCRHGPVPFAGCCNGDEDCDDGNPCTTDYCDVDDRCASVANHGPGCCQHHDDCGPGGFGDDGNSVTLGFCLSFQCVHVHQETPAGCSSHTDCDDQDPCTTDICLVRQCRHIQGPPDCVPLW